MPLRLPEVLLVDISEPDCELPLVLDPYCELPVVLLEPDAGTPCFFAASSGRWPGSPDVPRCESVFVPVCDHTGPAAMYVPANNTIEKHNPFFICSPPVSNPFETFLIYFAFLASKRYATVSPLQRAVFSGARPPFETIARAFVTRLGM